MPCAPQRGVFRFLLAVLALIVPLALAAPSTVRDDAAFTLSARQSRSSRRSDDAASASGRCPDVLTPPGTSRQLSQRVINGNLVDAMGGHIALSSPRHDTRTVRRCTGIRLSADWVLTAAHCNVTAEWTVLAMTTTADMGLPLSVDEVIAHPRYRSTTDRRYDAALLRVTGPPGPVFALPSNPSVPADAAFVRVAGFGTDPASASNAPEGDSEAAMTGSNDLRYVDIPVVPHDECAAAYAGSPNLGMLDSSRQVCAGYPAGVCDACSGDSGGPVTQFAADGTEVAVAMVSAAAGCARPGFPGINVRIAPLLEWIEESGAEFELADPEQQFAAGNIRPSEPVAAAAVADEDEGPTVTPSPSAAPPSPSPAESPASRRASPSPSESPAPSRRPRRSRTPTPSPSESPAPSATASPESSVSASPLPSPSETAQPSASPSTSPSLSASPVSSPSPSMSFAATLSPSPSTSLAPSVSLSPTPSASLSPSPTEEAATPSPTPSASATVAVAEPSPTPSEAEDEARDVAEDDDSASAAEEDEAAETSAEASEEAENDSADRDEAETADETEAGDSAAGTAGTGTDVRIVAGVAGGAALVLLLVGVATAVRSIRR